MAWEDKRRCGGKGGKVRGKIQRDRMAGCAFKELQSLWEGGEQGEGGEWSKTGCQKGH